jgi:carbamoyltransferase
MSYTGESVDQIAYYERPWLKNLRQWWTAERWYTDPVDVKGTIKHYFNTTKYTTHSHHLSHAAAGFATSPYDSAAVLVIDAIGEWETATIWRAWVDKQGQCRYKKMASIGYPHSLGLTYSAFTKRVGLRPLDEEYILMGMAAYGKPFYTNDIKQHIIRSDIWSDDYPSGLKIGIKNLRNCHRGLGNWPDSKANHFDIAASIQQVTDTIVYDMAKEALKITGESNLVYMGGVALNCVANAQLASLTNNVWIMPCPGDAGSSIGAAALAWGKKLNWTTAYLGHNITGSYPVVKLFNALLAKKIVGVASGRAEFGPRALGNRSLLADPRGPEIKDRVNEIKRRQRFRPFAPAILEEHAHNYFDMPDCGLLGRYMQVVARCRHPGLFPAIVHYDHTSRVQLVPKDGSGFRQLLELWYAQTGCPMLLNTSLNIRGQPMVNDRLDARDFEKEYGIPVIS